MKAMNAQIFVRVSRMIAEQKFLTIFPEYEKIFDWKMTRDQEALKTSPWIIGIQKDSCNVQVTSFTFFSNSSTSTLPFKYYCLPSCIFHVIGSQSIVLSCSLHFQTDLYVCKWTNTTIMEHRSYMELPLSALPHIINNCSSSAELKAERLSSFEHFNVDKYYIELINYC